jgi:hypothetical protein
VNVDEVDEALDMDERCLLSSRVNRGRGGYWLSMLRPAQWMHVEPCSLYWRILAMCRGIDNQSSVVASSEPWDKSRDRSVIL